MKRIAIVNRGEAAGRCIRAIRELRLLEGSDLFAIALYTDAERGAPFVRQADAAISLGPPLRAGRDGLTRPAYLDRTRVLAALRAARADAVWPGWGFVAEDPEFAATLEERGIIFIGPPSAVMRAVGDKIAAKRLAEGLGIAVTPWSRGPVTDDAAIAARRLGFPLMVKAAAGGGGRGIRAVRDEQSFAAALASARAEAAQAFGNDAVYLEAYLPHPRHIEVQIAADQHGGVASFGVRDCSVQRRHQKILEESPPPGLDQNLIGAIEDAALAIARAADYRGVGTVEFLLDRDGVSFYFLEVNPRLQVEHGVSEALTGCDLVALQIRLARGEALPAVPAARGHAVEVRVCAEDPQTNFAPSPGAISLIDLPAGPGIRTDCSAAVGTPVPAAFDSLVAKLIAHGPDRATTLARLQVALGDFRLMITDGATNKGFLLNLLEHPDIRAGGVDTGWLDRTLPALLDARLAPQALIAAAILGYLRERAIQRMNFYVEASRGEPQSIPPASGRQIDLTYRNRPYSFRVLALGDWRYRVHLEGRQCTAELLDQEGPTCVLAIGEERFVVEYAEGLASLQLEVDGQRHIVGRDPGGEIRATAPSVVVSIDVAAGDRVRAGQKIGILETMKIELALESPLSGVVQEVRARANQRVAAGDVLLIVHADLPAGDDDTPRVALPKEENRVAGGEPRHAITADDRYTRERARQAVAGTVRRLLLGYDTEPEETALVQAFFDTPIDAGIGEPVLRELTEIRHALAVFADTEVLFSRRPGATAGGGVTRSNDAELRSYLRRVEAAGAGIEPPFRELLERALRHYRIEDLTPSESLQRALFRLFAARRRRTERHRMIEAILRHLGRLLQAGAVIEGDANLATALGTCVVLRGEVPDTLADAAAEVRSAIFEVPEIERRTRLAADTVASVLERLDAGGHGNGGRDIVRSLADSAPAIFDAVIEERATASRRRRCLALHALVLRLYAPAEAKPGGDLLSPDAAAIRIDFADGRTLAAAMGRAQDPESDWDALCGAAATGPATTAAELFLHSEVDDADDLRRLGDRLMARSPLAAERLTITRLHQRGGELCVTWDVASGWRDDQGIHPETASRIGLQRLTDFDLQRLAAPRPLLAFLARSRSQPDDRRLFVFGEVHAAVPGISGTLHEATFVRVFSDTVRTLRRLRTDNVDWQELHWNRLVLVVRPAFHLTDATLRRLVDELLPATRHLGLERILVRLDLRADPTAVASTPRELVIEPASSGPARIEWREPHTAPLEPADNNARRVAAARRRGLIDPYEAIRSFAGSARPGDRFDEYDLEPDGRAVCVAGRAAGENSAAVVFGISVAHTEKYPDGFERVAILSDPTRGMGSLAKAECDRIVAALDLAAARSLPVEWFATSSGARIAMDSGTENLDAVAAVVRRIIDFTQAGGEINIVVTGTNVGAQSYFDALATMLMHTRGILIMTAAGSMVLTGKRALDASGAVSAEDERAIGGFEDIMGPNGQAQYFAADLDAAYAILLRHYELTSPRRRRTADPSNRDITADRCHPEDWPDAPAAATVGDFLTARANPDRKKPFSIRPVMRALIDRDSDSLERWSAMRGAETAVVWDAHIGGYPICLIGIENRALSRDGHPPPDGPSEWAGATLFPRSSKKVARSINAASGRRPVVILANLAGFDGSPESMRELQLEYGAEIARAVVNFRGPIFFVVTSRYHGGAYVVFSTRLNDHLHAIALRGSHASVIGGGPAATVIFSDRVRRLTDGDPRVVELATRFASATARLEKAALRSQLASLRTAVEAEHRAAVAAEFDRIHSVERALQVGSLDEIVAAGDLRRALVDHLAAVAASA